jgi:5'-3' exonuclease
VFVFDSVLGSTHRKELYPAYKAHRKSLVKDTEKERVQYMLDLYNNKMYDYLRMFGYTVCLSGIEADDLAALVVEYYKGTGKKVLLVSSDADWGSLISDTVHQLHLARDTVITLGNYEKEYSLKSPKDYMEYQYLCGLSKENVTGVHKLGKKRFTDAGSIEVIEDWLSTSKYGISLPEEVNSLQELYNRNKAVLKHLTIKDLDSDTIKSFKEQYNSSRLHLPRKEVDTIHINMFMDVLDDYLLDYYKVK